MERVYSMITEVMKWNIALVQANIKLGQPSLNQEHLRTLMEQAMAASIRPDVIVLPELWNTGYALTEIEQLADVDGQQSKAWLAEFAKHHAVHIVAGSVAESHEGQIRNTMYVFDKQGEAVAQYSKVHLFRLMEEEKYLTAGEQLVTFELDGQTAGASICYDIRFPEMARSLALQGAKLLFVPAEWPHPRLHHWRTLLTARAIENQMYVIACNRVGHGGKDHFFGHSLIIDPWGEIIAEGGEEETVIQGSVDLQLVDQVRSRIPVFEDRRPNLYQL